MTDSTALREKSDVQIAGAGATVRGVSANVATGLFLFAVFAFLYSPLLVTALFSFNESPVQTWPISGLSLHWYRELLSNGPLKGAAWYSLRISLTTVAVGVTFGTYFAFLTDRYVKRLRGVLLALLAIPVVLPGVVLGISLLVVFQLVSFQPGFWTIVIGHATFVTPMVMFVVLTRLRTLDPSLEQASFDLGAGRLQTFWYVTFPSIRVAVLAGALLGFTVSFDEIIVTFFLAGVDATLPVYVWNQLRFGFTPEVNAIFTIFGVVSVSVIVLATKLLTRSGSIDSLAGVSRPDTNRNRED
jgi:ABC-type spermidine/putrescine transport system permease subunit II